MEAQWLILRHWHVVHFATLHCLTNCFLTKVSSAAFRTCYCKSYFAMLDDNIGPKRNLITLLAVFYPSCQITNLYLTKPISTNYLSQNDAFVFVNFGFVSYPEEQDTYFIKCWIDHSLSQSFLTSKISNNYRGCCFYTANCKLRNIAQRFMRSQLFFRPALTYILFQPRHRLTVTICLHLSARFGSARHWYR